MRGTSPFQSFGADYPHDRPMEEDFYGPQPANLPLAVEDENNIMEQQSELSSLKPLRIFPSDENELHCWRSKRWELWQSREVLAWISDVARISGHIDFKLLHSERFNKKTGIDLGKMTQADFEELEPKYGAQIYSAFRDYVRETSYKPPAEMPDLTDFNNNSFLDLMQDDRIQTDWRKDCDDMLMMQGDDMTSDMDVIDREEFYNMAHHLSSHVLPPHHAISPVLPGIDDIFSSKSRIPVVVSEPIVPQEPPKAKRGRPRKQISPLDAKAERSKIIKNRKGRTKQIHLWEFVVNLLKDATYNPSHVLWESKSDGVFRFVQSEKVAKLWGDHKNNPNMTYDKMARAMRHYYKNGVLLVVPGRQLLYKFGPSSYDWQNTSSHDLS